MTLRPLMLSLLFFTSGSVAFACGTSSEPLETTGGHVGADGGAHDTGVADASDARVVALDAAEAVPSLVKADAEPSPPPPVTDAASAAPTHAADAQGSPRTTTQ